MSSALPMEISECEQLKKVRQEFPTVLGDISDFEGIKNKFNIEKFFFQELHEQFDKQADQTSDPKANLPAYHAAKAARLEKIFEELKDIYLDVETKERFLKTVQKETHLLLDQSDLDRQEKKNASRGKSLNSAELVFSEVKSEIRNVCANSIRDHEQTVQDITNLSALIDQTQEKEQKLTDLSNPEKNEIKMKLEKSQRILDEQTQEFQDVYSSIEEKKINVNDLKWKIETLQQEVTQLQEQRQSAEKKVLAISSKAQNQDPRVEKLCKWYRHANNGYREMVGVESVEMSSEAELVIRFKIPRFSNPALHIFIDPNTQTIEDASVVNWDGDITDIIDFAKRFDNLPFLIAQVRARILETSS